MKVTIDIALDHKGNPRGSGKAEAVIIFIDRQGKRYERKATATVENDTKNALALKITTAALKILIKPCDVEIHLDNDYIKNCIKNGWLEEWQQHNATDAAGRRKRFYADTGGHGRGITI
ncbi:MAG: hypothetical protein KHW49_00360 [Eubacterium sp.]|nr:hypothetical protein [Eubacterium sp.]